MVKISNVAIFLAVGSASAFSPPVVNHRATAFVRPSTHLSMAEEESAGKLVAIKEETVEFTAGILGGVVGFAVGGPVLGALGAAATNYIAKSGGEFGDVLSTVSKSAIEVYNSLLKVDEKYEVLTKAQASLESAIVKVKASNPDNVATIEKLESALASTTSKIKEVNDEYDLVGSGLTALGVIGDLVEKAIIKGTELNSEYELSAKAVDVVKDAVQKGKEATKKIA